MRILKTREAKHKTLLKFLVSYVVILLIPLSVGFLAYNEALRLLEEDARNANLTLLEQSKDILDRRFDEIDSMVNQIANNSRVKQILNVSGPIQGSDAFIVWDALRDLSYYILRNNFISDFYIYCRKSNIILSSSSSYIRLPIHYDESFKYANMTYPQWKEKILDGYHHKQYMPASPMLVNGKSGSTILYLQSLPLAPQEQQCDGTIMVLIDENEIHKLLSRLNIEDGGWAYVADHNGQIITSVSSDKAKAPLVHFNDNRLKGFTDTMVDGKKMTVSFTTSSYNRWTYVAVLPYSVVMANAAHIQKITWDITLFSLLLGIIIAFLLAYWNSKPFKKIRNLTKTVRDILGGDESCNPGSEYDFLQSTISRLIESNKDLQSAVQKQVPVMKTAFFDRLLRGEFNHTNEIEAAALQMDININYGRFIAIVLRINGYKGLITKDILNELNLMKIVVKNVILGIVQENGYLHSLNYDKLALVLWFDSQSEEECVRRTEEIVDQTCDELGRLYNIKMSFAAGNMYDSIADICRSYDEAMRSLEYRKAEQHQILIWYNRLPKVSRTYFYPTDLNLRLANLVKAGDKEEVVKLVNEIFEENFLKRQLSSDMLWQLLYEMRGTIIKLLDEMVLFNKLYQEKVNELRNSVIPFSFDEQLENIYHSFTGIFMTICGMVREQKKSHNVRLKERILEYMNHCYTETDISLRGVAEQFDISEAYLCQFFKDQTGVNFSDYLEQLRIQQAYELLIKTELCVNDIALKVGYNSAHAFRRAFKRVNGVNPMDYRELKASEANT